MNIRQRAILKLGGTCQNCGKKDNLQLHHITYAEDSVRWWESGEYWKRAREAFEHPERFELRCKNCHNKQHEDDPVIEDFVKMSIEAKLALKKSFRDAKKSGKTRRLTKYEIQEFDELLKNKPQNFTRVRAKKIIEFSLSYLEKILN